MVTFTHESDDSTIASKRSVRHVFRRILETAGRVIFGQEMRMVTSVELDRLQRLAYRERLREAETAGDHAFIESELRRNQLTEEDLRRLQRHHTRLQDWPDAPDDLIEPEDAPPPAASDTTMQKPS